MPTFVLLTKMPREGIGDLSKLETAEREWLQEVKNTCPEIHWLDHYALFGPYNILDIYEAPNEETAAKVSMISMSLAAAKAESWAAFPYRRFLKVVKDFGKTAAAA